MKLIFSLWLYMCGRESVWVYFFLPSYLRFSHISFSTVGNIHERLIHGVFGGGGGTDRVILMLFTLRESPSVSFLFEHITYKISTKRERERKREILKRLFYFLTRLIITKGKKQELTAYKLNRITTVKRNSYKQL